MLTPEQLKDVAAQNGLTITNPKATGAINPAPQVNPADEFAKRVGYTPPQPTVVDAIKETAGSTFKDLQSNIDQTVEGSKNPDGSINPAKAAVAIPTGAAKSVLRVGSGIVEGAGKSIMNLVSPLIPQEVKDKGMDFMTHIAEAWNTRPDEATDPEGAVQYDKVHALAGKISDLAKKNPEVTKSLGDAFNVVTAAMGGEGLTSKTMKNVFEKTLSQVESKATSLLEKGKSILPKKVPTFEETLAESKKILNPSEKYTPTEVEKLRQKGEVKIKGKGPFKKEVADPRTNAQHETLAELVGEGKISSKNLPSENMKIIRQEARINDANIDEIVNRPELNKPFNKNKINQVFEGVENSAKKDLVFVSDTTEEKIYKAVMNVAKEEIAKNPYNSAGLRKSVKAFNARMEEILGKDIYGGSSESIGNARLQAAKDVRKALSDFLADNLESPPIKVDKALAGKKVVNKLPAKAEYETGKIQGGDVYRSQIRREAQLLNAADEIAYRTRGTLNKTQIRKWLDAHPKTKRVLKYGATAVAGGVATDVIMN